MTDQSTQETEPAEAPVIETNTIPDPIEHQIATDALKDWEPESNGFGTDLTDHEMNPAPEPDPEKPQERERDEHGRFKAKDTEGNSEAETPETSEDSPTEPETVETIEAPHGMTAEQRAAFDQLPPEGQRILVDQAKAQQADYTRKTQEIAENRGFLESQMNLVERGQQYLNQAMPGVEFNDAVERFFGADASLRNPTTARQTIEGLIRDYQIDMGQQPQAPQQRENDIYADPAVTALNQRFQTIEAQFQQQAAAQAEAQQQALRQPYEAAAAHQQAVFSEFRQTKGDDGQLSYPHVEKVEHTMSLMLQSPDLNEMLDRDPNGAFKEAYDRAVYADPNLRKSEMDARIEAERKARVEAASKVGQHTRSGVRPNSQRRISSASDAVLNAMDESGFNGFN